MAAESSVARYEGVFQLFRTRGIQQQGHPETLVPCGETAAVVNRRKAMHGGAGYLKTVSPVHFTDLGNRNAPVLKILAHPEGTDETRHLAFQCRDSEIIQMVPVIVGNYHGVEFRHIVRSVAYRALERAQQHALGPYIAEHRVHKEAHSPGLDEYRCMPQPDAKVPVPVQRFDIRPDYRHFAIRSGFTAREEQRKGVWNQSGFISLEFGILIAEMPSAPV